MLDVLHPQRIARANCDDRARPPGVPSSLASCSCWGAHAARVLVSAARRDELQSTVLQSRVPPVTRHSALVTLCSFPSRSSLRSRFGAIVPKCKQGLSEFAHQTNDAVNNTFEPGKQESRKGISEVEGKAARAAAKERGQRLSFNSGENVL